jgi:hypothetical protein
VSARPLQVEPFTHCPAAAGAQAFSSRGGRAPSAKPTAPTAPVGELVRGAAAAVHPGPAPFELRAAERW